MTVQDRVMLLGCLTVACLTMISLSATAPVPHPMAAARLAASSQPLQLSRVHSLTAVSARAVSVF